MRPSKPAHAWLRQLRVCKPRNRPVLAGLSGNRPVLAGLGILGLVSAIACGGSGEEAVRAESERAWGRGKKARAVRNRADEPLQATGLASDRRLFERVRTMRFQEVAARLGPVLYTGQARFVLTTRRDTLDVFEDTRIRYDAKGAWRIVQRDEDGALTRELLFVDDRSYVRNGPGRLRTRSVADTPPEKALDEAFEPLRALTGWFGERLELTPARRARVGRRPAVRYRWRLRPGTRELVRMPGLPRRVSPLDVSGHFTVDAKTAAPLSASLQGRLEVEPAPPSRRYGQLEVSLEFALETSNQPVRVREAMPPIGRRVVQLDPLGFLKGRTRTSTVIGGPRLPRPGQ